MVTIPPEIEALGLIDIRAAIPDVQLDIVYATADNFTGEQLYSSPRAFVTPDMANLLKSVDRDLQQEGYRLGIWDAYRPFSVSQKMAAIVSDRSVVAATVPSLGEPGKPQVGSMTAAAARILV